jgi:hypothetical protein
VYTPFSYVPPGSGVSKEAYSFCSVEANPERIPSTDTVSKSSIFFIAFLVKVIKDYCPIVRRICAFWRGKEGWRERRGTI